jgi:hypothetical protein
MKGSPVRVRASASRICREKSVNLRPRQAAVWNTFLQMRVSGLLLEVAYLQAFFCFGRGRDFWRWRKGSCTVERRPPVRVGRVLEAKASCGGYVPSHRSGCRHRKRGTFSAARSSPRTRGGSLHLGEALRVQGFSDGDLSAIAD